MHMGRGVEMGVAYCVQPAGAPPGKPATFVCNIGDMGGKDLDQKNVGHSTRRMVSSLKTAAVSRKGFHGQYLAQFRGSDRGVRQLNLTAWSCDEAAHEWYVNNEDHAQLMVVRRPSLA